MGSDHAVDPLAGSRAERAATSLPHMQQTKRVLKGCQDGSCRTQTHKRGQLDRRTYGRGGLTGPLGEDCAHPESAHRTTDAPQRSADNSELPQSSDATLRWFRGRLSTLNCLRAAGRRSFEYRAEGGTRRLRRQQRAIGAGGGSSSGGSIRHHEPGRLHHARASGPKPSAQREPTARAQLRQQDAREEGAVRPAATTGTTVVWRMGPQRRAVPWPTVSAGATAATGSATAAEQPCDGRSR
eukprot:30953-Chlamydomonas_euryale.AAC.5